MTACPDHAVGYVKLMLVKYRYLILTEQSINTASILLRSLRYHCCQFCLKFFHWKSCSPTCSETLLYWVILKKMVLTFILSQPGTNKAPLSHVSWASCSFTLKSYLTHWLTNNTDFICHRFKNYRACRASRELMAPLAVMPCHWEGVVLWLSLFSMLWLSRYLEVSEYLGMAP